MNQVEKKLVIARLLKFVAKGRVGFVRARPVSELPLARLPRPLNLSVWLGSLGKMLTVIFSCSPSPFTV